MPTTTAAFAAEDLNDMQVRELISRALDAKMGDNCSCYVQDVNRIKGFATYTQYGSMDPSRRGALYRVSFSVADDYTISFGEAEKVVAVTEYEAAADFSLETGAAQDGPRARFSVETSGRRVEGDYAIYPNSLLFRAGDYPDKNFSMSPQELQRAAEGWQEVSGNIQHTDFLKGRAAFISKAWTEDDGQVLRGEVRVPLALDELLTDGEKYLSMEWHRAGKFAEGFALCTNPRVSDAALMSVGDKIPQPTAGPAGRGKEPKPVTFFEKLKALFTEAGIDVDAAGESKQTGEASAEELRLRKELIETKAAAFADKEIAERRALPAERSDLIAEYTQAATDDARPNAGTVSFTGANGAQVGSRVDALVARHAKRTAHRLTDEVLGGAVIFGTDTQGGGADTEPAAPNPTAIFSRRAQQCGQTG